MTKLIQDRLSLRLADNIARERAIGGRMEYADKDLYPKDYAALMELLDAFAPAVVASSKRSNAALERVIGKPGSTAKAREALNAEDAACDARMMSAARVYFRRMVETKKQGLPHIFQWFRQIEEMLRPMATQDADPWEMLNAGYMKRAGAELTALVLSLPESAAAVAANEHPANQYSKIS